MRQKCKICNHNCESGDLCWKHKNRKILPEISKNKTYDVLVNKEVFEKFDKALKQDHTFTFIWETRPHRSEVSNKFLGAEILSAYFHHILPKNKYPQAEFDKENIILLTWEEHDQVEIDMYYYEEINKRRKQLKTKYGII